MLLIPKLGLSKKIGKVSYLVDKRLDFFRVNYIKGFRVTKFLKESNLNGSGVYHIHFTIYLR